MSDYDAEDMAQYLEEDAAQFTAALVQDLDAVGGDPLSYCPGWKVVTIEHHRHDLCPQTVDEGTSTYLDGIPAKTTREEVDEIIAEHALTILAETACARAHPTDLDAVPDRDAVSEADQRRLAERLRPNIEALFPHLYAFAAERTGR